MRERRTDLHKSVYICSKGDKVLRSRALLGAPFPRSEMSESTSGAESLLSGVEFSVIRSTYVT